MSTSDNKDVRGTDRMKELQQVEERLNKLIDIVEKVVLEKTEDKAYREKHAMEHEWLRRMIQKEKARAETAQALKIKILGGSIWALVTGIGSVIIWAFTHGLFEKP